MAECEWNPETGTAANIGEPSHADATVSVGSGTWHLCASCASLERFKRFKKTPLRSGQAAKDKGES